MHRMQVLVSAVFAIVFAIGSVDSAAKKIPSYIPICKYSDPNLSKCFQDSFNIAIEHMNDGIPEMNLMKIDPVTIETLAMDYGNGTAISFGAVLTNLTLHGFPAARLVDAELDLEKLSWKMAFAVEKLRMRAKFRAQGRVLLLRFDSDGSFTGNISGVKASGEWLGKKVQKNGKEHILFTRSELDMEVKDVKMNFENLFPTEEINDRMNAVINENIDVFYDELKPIFVETIKSIVIQSVNTVYDIFPFETLFPK